MSEGFDESHPDALAIYCSDGRFTREVESLLRRLGHQRLDTMTLPGGPALLCTSGANLSEVDTFDRAAHFLIVAHNIVHVVLVCHEGCGYYRNRYPRLAALEIQKRQLEHLVMAGKALARRHTGLRIDRYYARVSEGRIVFHEIAAEPGAGAKPATPAA